MCLRSKKKTGKGGNTSSYELFDKYGVENCKITLLEVCSCNSKDELTKRELTKRESHYIKSMLCVNKVVPNRTYAEWRNDNREQYIIIRKKYRDANKEKISLSEKVTNICECGFTHRHWEKCKHFRTKKHLKFMAETESLENQSNI
jgi:hypothetical protein